METTNTIELRKTACRIRIELLKELAALGSGHLGGSLDLCDLLAVLYWQKMDIDSKDPCKEDRDYFVLSKGHAGPALYAALALRGYSPVEMLATLNQPGTKLPSHCDRTKTPGIDMTTGSLGQGAGAAVGIALGNKLKGLSNKTYCVIGDGEMQEGQIWEVMMLAPALGLENLILIVDNNGQQLDDFTKNVVDYGDIPQKARDFGWYTVDVDGHDVQSIGSGLQLAQKAAVPAFVNLHTLKGKGWKEWEGLVPNHHVKAINNENTAAPIAALESEIQALCNCAGEV